MKVVDLEKLKRLLDETRESPLDPASVQELRTAVECYKYLAELVAEEGTTAERVRQRFFKRFNIVQGDEAPGVDDPPRSV